MSNNVAEIWSHGFQCDYGVDPDIVISSSSSPHATTPKNQPKEPEDTPRYLYKEEYDPDENDDDMNGDHLFLADQHS